MSRSACRRCASLTASSSVRAPSDCPRRPISCSTTARTSGVDVGVSAQHHHRVERRPLGHAAQRAVHRRRRPGCAPGGAQHALQHLGQRQRVGLAVGKRHEPRRARRRRAGQPAPSPTGSAPPADGRTRSRPTNPRGCRPGAAAAAPAATRAARVPPAPARSAAGPAPRAGSQPARSSVGATASPFTAYVVVHAADVSQPRLDGPAVVQVGHPQAHVAQRAQRLARPQDVRSVTAPA